MKHTNKVLCGITMHSCAIVEMILNPKDAWGHRGWQAENSAMVCTQYFLNISMGIMILCYKNMQLMPFIYLEEELCGLYH